jgi:hypothetical protein
MSQVAAAVVCHHEAVRHVANHPHEVVEIVKIIIVKPVEHCHKWAHHCRHVVVHCHHVVDHCHHLARHCGELFSRR